MTLRMVLRIDGDRWWVGIPGGRLLVHQTRVRNLFRRLPVIEPV